jgi:hypothetical protein
MMTIGQPAQRQRAGPILAARGQMFSRAPALCSFAITASFRLKISRDKHPDMNGTSFHSFISPSENSCESASQLSV